MRLSDAARSLRSCVPHALILVSLIACSSDTPAGVSSPTLRDSAGVRIVDNGPAAPSSASIKATATLGEPLLSLGAVDGPPERLFAGVGAVAVFEDGRLAIADRSNQIRVFEPDGAYVGAFGREGDGPGEFRRVDGLWVLPNRSLVALDVVQWRVTVMADGDLDATFPVRPRGPNPSRARGFLANGDVVISERIYDFPDIGFLPQATVVRRVPLTTAAVDTVATLKGARFGRVQGTEDMVGRPMFEPGVVVSAAGGRIVVSDCRVPEFRELAPDGSLLRIVRWDGGDRTVGAVDVEAYRSERLAAALSEEGRRQVTTFLDAMPVNDVLPACTAIHAVDDEVVWVRTYPRRTKGADAAQRWEIFEDGVWVGRIDLPSGAALMAVGEDRLATVERDDLDVEHVVVYARPQPSQATHRPKG